MSIEIISVGNEILLGRTVNTNAAYLSYRLAEEGWSVGRQTTLPDESTLLTRGLQEALDRSSIVISTGGVGPTLDDNTAAAAQKLFSQKPEQIPNGVGSAAGFIFKEGKKALILLPGVPQEMEPMFEESVLPFLKQQTSLAGRLYQESVHFYLLKETEVDPLLRKLQDRFDIDIGIYPSYGTLTVVFRGADKDRLQAAKTAVAEAFAASLLPAPSGKIEEALHLWMQKHRKTVAFAESCTGGLMAAQIVAMAGASDYFLGSLVTYSNQMKEQCLGVSSGTLKKHGAVSQEAVQEMWKGLMAKTGADYGIAVSGIAGPTGGTAKKPVGTIWYALGCQGGEPEVGTFHVKGGRQTVILRTTQRLFALLWKQLSQDS